LDLFRLTTAFLEGLNSWFSAFKCKSRGCHSREDQIAMLYFVACKFEIPYYAWIIYYPLQMSKNLML